MKIRHVVVAGALATIAWGSTGASGNAEQFERLSARRWIVRLPRRLHGARILDISVDGKDASGNTWDANFWGGIRSACA